MERRCGCVFLAPHRAPCARGRCGGNRSVINPLRARRDHGSPPALSRFLARLPPGSMGGTWEAQACAPRVPDAGACRSALARRRRNVRMMDRVMQSRRPRGGRAASSRSRPRSRALQSVHQRMRPICPMRNGTRACRPVNIPATDDAGNDSSVSAGGRRDRRTESLLRSALVLRTGSPRRPFDGWAV